MRVGPRYLVCTSLLLAAILAGQAKADVLLSGTVAGKSGEEAVSAGVVTLKAYRKGAIVKSGLTQEQGQPKPGSYSLLVPGTDPIDRITFEAKNAQWHPWVVGAISAQGEAKLPVLLFPDKGPLRYDLYVEQLLAYEQLLYLAIEGIDEPTLETQLHRFRRHYWQRLLRMPSPKELEGITPRQLQMANQKRGAVLQLYGVPDLRHTRWATEFKETDGRMVPTVATIDGQSGTNDLVKDGQLKEFGALSNLEFGWNGERLTIEGEWQVIRDDNRGYFRWEIDPRSPHRFSGEWGVKRTDGPLGWWNGVSFKQP
jgi:hypothetical protein